ncbi:MAG: hypothetical protein QM817_15760 [Archangium sp.]
MSSLAFAQTEQPKPHSTPKPQNIIFDGNDLIEAGVATPDGEFVTSRPQPKFGNLIKVRVNFNDKLMASVHEL